MRENGTICPFGVFFPCFIVFFASTMDMFPLKRSVLGVYKGALRGSKRTNCEFVVPRPKKHKNHCETGEKTSKGQMVPFTRAHISPVVNLKRFGCCDDHSGFLRCRPERRKARTETETKRIQKLTQPLKKISQALPATPGGG